MLVLSFGLWFVILFSLRVVVYGNPAYRHVMTADDDLVERAEALTLEGKRAESGEVFLFLRRFSLLLVLETAVFLTETSICLLLWQQGILPRLCLLLVTKNAIMFALAVFATFRYGEGGIFKTMRTLPHWLNALERAVALVTVAGAAPLFLAVNNVPLW